MIAGRPRHHRYGRTRAALTALALCAGVGLAALSTSPASAAGDAAISGTVTAAGAPLPSARVSLLSYDDEAEDWERYAEKAVDSDGDYSFSAPAGTYRIEFEAATFRTEWWDGASDLESATDVTIAPGESVVHRDAALEPDPVLSGRVLDDSGAVAAGVFVVAESADNSETRRVRSDADGRFQMSVPAGPYIVCFESPSYRPECWKDAADRDEARTVDVANDLKLGDARLTAYAAIRGRVTTSSGVPLPDVNLTVIDDNYGGVRVRTDSEGRYVARVAPGTYAVYAQDVMRRYRGEFWDDAARLRDATSVTLDDSDVPGVDFSLPRVASSPISGTVSDTKGAAVPGVQVGVFVDGTSVASTVSGADGKYSVRLPQGERYTVQFLDTATQRWATQYSGGAATPEEAQVIDLSGPVTQNATLHQRGSRITGRLTNTDGGPAAGILVSAGRPRRGEDPETDFHDRDFFGYGYEEAHTTSADDGTYTMLVEPGAYRVDYSDPSGTTVGDDDEPNRYDSACWSGAGQPTDGDGCSTLTPANGQTLRADSVLRNHVARWGGVVRNALGEPLGGIEVTFFNDDSDACDRGEEQTVTTDDDGRYEFGFHSGYGCGPDYDRLRGTVLFSDPLGDYDSEFWNDASTPSAAAHFLLHRWEWSLGNDVTLAANQTVVTQTQPTITGTPQARATLTANPGSYSVEPDALTYQWLAGDTAIAGATGKTFKPTAAEVGKKLSVRVRASKDGYLSATPTSASTAPVAKSPVVLKVTGKGDVKKATLTVTATGTGFTPAGTVTVLEGTRGLKSVTLSAGKAVVVLTSQTKATHTYTVKYSGNGDTAAAATTVKVAVR